MDKALVFGTKDCRFESCQGHFSLSFKLHGGSHPLRWGSTANNDTILSKAPAHVV